MDGVEDDGLAAYEVPFEQAGEYDVELELDETLQGETETAQTLELTEPEDELLGVFLSDGEDGPFIFEIAEGLTDFETLEDS